MGVQRIIPLGLIERSKRLERWSSIAIETWRQRIDERNETLSKIIELDRLRVVLERALEQLHRHQISIRDRLQRLISSPVDCHWIVRDLWRENVLIDRDRISGIIDFGAARVDWPALEIARWISSWLEPDDPRISKLFEANPILAEDDFRFLDHSTTLLSLLQWFDWLLFSDQSFEGREDRVRSRILELDKRLSVHFDQTY